MTDAPTTPAPPSRERIDDLTERLPGMNDREVESVAYELGYDYSEFGADWSPHQTLDAVVLYPGDSWVDNPAAIWGYGAEAESALREAVRSALIAAGEEERE